MAILVPFCLVAPVVAQSDFLVDDAVRKMETLLRVIDRSYVDTVNNKELSEKAVRSFLKELDPHSVYISKEDLKNMNEPLVGSFEGIGIQFNILRDTILVVSPISGGPSERLGIRPGDKIVSVDGENMAGIGVTNKDVMDKLRGKKGTQVTVSVVRRGVKKPMDFTITRDKIPIYSVDAGYMATPEIGYIKLNRFSATSMKEIHKKMDTLQTLGMEDLILDLRGNSGGYLQTAIDLADDFLSMRKLIVYTQGRSFPRDERLATKTGRFETGKLVVLIDNGSASASEIVSGAVQDWDRGLVVGRRSFGKGLVQKPYTLSDGSVVRLTIQRYYTPTGRCIQKPYEDYKNDFLKRMESGELFNKDSIDLPDSLKFYTPKDRIVYGGGGIIPDIFVPLDTSMNSAYYTSVLRKGIINRFTLDYIDKNRKNLEETYPDLQVFRSDFDSEAILLDDFVEFAKKEGIEPNDDQLQTSKKPIVNLLKAYIARGLWGSDGYYEIFNQINPTFLKAIEVLGDDTFEKMELVYK